MDKKDLNFLQTIDPVKKQGEVSATDRGASFSPMSPPEAHAPPGAIKIDYHSFHPYLKIFVDEHTALKARMDEFQKILRDLSLGEDISLPTDKKVRSFYKDFHRDFHVHNRREEEVLFPVLRTCFLEIGEHSKTARPITPINVMIDEHQEAFKVATEAVCAWELLAQLFDPPSRTILLKAFIRKSNTLLEMMRLHIYREDDIIFSLAQRHLSQKILDQLLEAHQEL